MKYFRVLCAGLILASAGGALAQDQPLQKGSLSWTAKVEVWRHARLEAVRAKDDSQLNAFTTDGCSGGMSAAWMALAETFPSFYQTFEHQAPWHNCCVVHDKAYHLGGATSDPQASFYARLRADEALRHCVKQVADSESGALSRQYSQSPQDIETVINFVADRMFEAVRVGGLPCSGLPWRWGYGWPQCW
ncbi:hypothetical protein [Shimia sp. NS0008-38b]|uniref:hypothetical protein n=1 Tax=Shimia sp. NS0008-38b TaxID=3127653 RepID=UPI00333FD9FF